MNQRTEHGDGFVVPYIGLPRPKDFEICWASEFRSPDPLMPPLFCIGSVDGRLIITNQDLSRELPTNRIGSGSGTAINGVACALGWVAVSTREELSFSSITEPKSRALLHGAHGVVAAPGGYFVAPLGNSGILLARPPFDNDSSLMCYTPGREQLYVYRVVTLRSPTAGDVLACATRRGGIVAGQMPGSHNVHTMSTVAFGNLDIVDICALAPESESLGLAALGRDGTVILSRDVLTDKNPQTFKFKSVTGIAYRILSHRGDIYILTSKGLHVLGELGSRFLTSESMQGVTTQVLPMPIAALDMNLAWNRWLLLVVVNEVRRFDADFLHDYVPQQKAEGQVEEEPVILHLEPTWTVNEPTTQRLAVA